MHPQIAPGTPTSQEAAAALLLGFIVVMILIASLNHYLTSRAEHNQAVAQAKLVYQIQVDQLQLLEFALLNQEDPFLSENRFYKEINTCHETQ